MRQSMNNPTGAFEKENKKSIFISLPFNLSDLVARKKPKNNLNKTYETKPLAVREKSIGKGQKGI